MTIGRTLSAGFLAAAITFGLVAFDADLARADSTRWYPDARGDAIPDNIIDITQWGVSSDRNRVTVAVDAFRDPATLSIDPVSGLADSLRLSVSGMNSASPVTVHWGPGGTQTITGCAGATAGWDAASKSYWLRETCTGPKREVNMSYATQRSHVWSGSDTALAGPPQTDGYVMVTAAGDVHSFGGDNCSGGATPSPGATIVDVEPISYSTCLLLDSAGRVTMTGRDYTHFGDADLHPGERAVSISVMRQWPRGYWIFTDKGRAIAFGNAQHFGDMNGVVLNGPVLDSIATPSGNGYYMVASDGGVFAFGDAQFHGSMGGIRLNAPVQSLVPAPSGTGYWLVASDGGVFAFHAPFMGSMGSIRLNKPVTGMVPFGNGYLMVGEDGGIFNFSDRQFLGSLGSNPPASPVVAVAAT